MSEDLKNHIAGALFVLLVAFSLAATMVVLINEGK